MNCHNIESYRKDLLSSFTR